MSVSEPGKIITPWAESGLKNTIPPAANPATGRAGFDQGFSAINMTAKEAGGIPPFGQDFNGIFYEVTNILRYMQAGGQPTFDAALATAIGGYPLGAVLIGDDGVSVFKNAVAGNETNPNTGGDGWARPDLQMMELYRRSYAEAGYNVVGTFGGGFTIVNANDVGIDLATGKGYTGPAGAVAAGTDPASGGFVDRSGELLRSHAVGVDAGTSASLQVMTDRGSVMFTEVAGPATTGDLVIGGVVYRLTPANVESFSSLSDTPQDVGCGWPQLETAEDAKIKSRKAPIQVTSDDVATNGTMKAWRMAEGIRDAATAGSFMTGYESEPDSQVIGFTGFDKIGSYQARDSVALFSQVQGQATTCSGAFNYTATTVTGTEIQANWDKIKVGMILDTNLGNTGTYKGAVVIGKVDPYTLQVSPWVNAAGATVAPPTNGTTGRINQRTHLWGLNSNAIVNNGAVQGIGAEIGMSCLTVGSGTNSKVIYAVNLGDGEQPEFGFYGKGPFRKGYTVVGVSEFAFYSKGLLSVNASHFRAEDETGALVYDYGPNGLRYGAIDYALVSVSGQLSTRPLTLANGDNLVMTMPALKQGRHLRYRNVSATVHTVNGISVPAGALIEFISDGSSWIRLCTIP